MPDLRIVIADDHAILRAGLRLLIEKQSGMTVVGEADNWESALSALLSLQPDVATIDLSMPGGNAFNRLRQLRDAVPATQLIVLTMHDDEDYYRSSLAAGANGYVLKSSADRDLITAIRTVAEGKPYTTVEICSQKTSETAVDIDTAVPCELAMLSPREMEVLRQVARGLTNREIADGLFLSVKTVESYRARLMAKLRLKSRADLVHFSIQHGLLQQES